MRRWPNWREDFSYRTFQDQYECLEEFYDDAFPWHAEIITVLGHFKTDVKALSMTIFELENTISILAEEKAELVELKDSIEKKLAAALATVEIREKELSELKVNAAVTSQANVAVDTGDTTEDGRTLESEDQVGEDKITITVPDSAIATWRESVLRVRSVVANTRPRQTSQLSTACSRSMKLAWSPYSVRRVRMLEGLEA